MKKLIIFGAVIALCLGCGNEDEGDGAVLIMADADEPHCGPGNLIVYTRGDIFYCDEYGGSVTRVTKTRETNERNPCWSPDGEYIAYHGYDAEKRNGGIFVIPKGGGEPVQLTTDGGDDPAWSPDGDTIAYNDRSDSDIWAISPNDREPRRLTERGWCSSPAWAPDGERIYFAGPDPKDAGGPCSLWYVDPAGQRVVRLWSYPDSFHDLAVRPGGEWQAAVFFDPNGRDNIWLIEIKTGKRYRLTDEPEPDYGD
jgi:Tol biopolymer transport system component